MFSLISSSFYVDIYVRKKKAVDVAASEQTREVRKQFRTGARGFRLEIIPC